MLVMEEMEPSKYYSGISDGASSSYVLDLGFVFEMLIVTN